MDKRPLERNASASDKFEHTPGPWELCEVTDGRGRAVDDHGYVTAGELDEDDYCEIKVDGINAAANARLIAAAPELLAELKHCVWLLNDLQPKTGLKQARAAIAKAEGAP